MEYDLSGEIDAQIEEKVSLPSPLEEFDAAIKTITTERGKVYGHPLDNFIRAQKLITEVVSCPNVGVRHALMLICVKMARLVNSPDHLDSWIDLVGYARTAVMCLDKEKESDK